MKYNILKRQIKSVFQHIWTKNKYRGCSICNSILYKNPQPVIYTYKLKKTSIGSLLDNPFTNSYVKMIFCKDCWDSLSVQDRIDIYFVDLKETHDPIYIIKNICKQSNVDPTIYVKKYETENKKKVRKMKLNEIESRR